MKIPLRETDFPKSSDYKSRHTLELINTIGGYLLILKIIRVKSSIRVYSHK